MPDIDEKDQVFERGKSQGRFEYAIESICRDMIEIKTDIRSVKDELTKTNKENAEEMKELSEKVNNNKMIIAKISATTAIIITLLVLILRDWIAK